MPMKRAAAALALLLGCAAPAHLADAGDPAGPAATPVVERPVDLVLCLDTSNSMDGLIDAAKRRLWDVVNDVAKLRPVPHLRVALLSYGNNSYSAAEGWVVTDAPFTEDLDFISQKLFALRTGGGTELVGRVLDTALERLTWSDDPQALRIAIVAGNETADQDPLKPFRDVCSRAAKKSVIVNSIYCGSPTDEIAPSWREVAKLGEGEFAAIDQNRAEPVCATPYDDLLAKLSTAYNGTCIPYGAHGGTYLANQSMQDGNAASLGRDAAAARAATKASSNYCGRNDVWDLVDACGSKQVDLAKLAAADLPEAMQKMTVEERAKYVEAKSKERAELLKQMAELTAKRGEFIAAEMKKTGPTDDTSLASAVRRAVRKQAERRGFTFEAK